MLLNVIFNVKCEHFFLLLSCPEFGQLRNCESGGNLCSKGISVKANINKYMLVFTCIESIL